jgi:hypothetical protein
MKLSNAVKKLEREGWAVTAEEPRRDIITGAMMLPCFHHARKAGNRHVITVSRNGGGDEVATIKVGSVTDRDDPITDYYPGTYCDSLAQAIRIASRPDGGR